MKATADRHTVVFERGESQPVVSTDISLDADTQERKARGKGISKLGAVVGASGQKGSGFQVDPDLTGKHVF